jgi:hypothetical protein
LANITVPNTRAVAIVILLNILIPVLCFNVPNRLQISTPPSWTL